MWMREALLNHGKVCVALQGGSNDYTRYSLVILCIIELTIVSTLQGSMLTLKSRTLFQLLNFRRHKQKSDMPLFT